MIAKESGTHSQSPPLYTLSSAADLMECRGDGFSAEWVWLPNSIVTGVADEVPPVDRLRALQDVRLLHGFVELYAQQALADDGGIPPALIATVYKRRCITERGHWIVWGFNPGETRVAPDFAMFRRWQEGQSHLEAQECFLTVWRELLRTGLFECVPHVLEADSDEAAMLFPCPGPDDAYGTRIEKEVGTATRDAAERIIGDELCRRLDEWDIAIPIPGRFPKVAVLGVYRLRYRARTRAAAAWIVRQRELAKIVDNYRQLETQARLGHPLTALIG
jgi:hypothetical protein